MKKLKNDKTKYIFILVAIMVVLTSFHLLWLKYHAPSEQPDVQDGILDLQEFHLEEDQTMMLTGEWTFYPEKLVDPQHIDKKMDTMKKVPMEAGENYNG